MKWIYLLVLLIPIAFFELLMIRSVLMSTKKKRVYKRYQNESSKKKMYKNKYNIVK